jgi:nicotinamide-nucleotide amidase
MDNLDAWILTIGNEIVNGVITDTNRETITRELRTAGITVKGMSSVGDDPALIADALENAMARAVITIVSGGLGPTEDDKTSGSAAAFLGVDLKLDTEQLARIEDRFRQWKRPMAPSNAKQAMLPAGSVPIPNDHGTAPGFMIEKNGRVALFFPGVPRELIRMLREQGLPKIAGRFGVSRDVFRTRTLIVYGFSESKLGELLADVAQDEDSYHLAFLPRFPIIRLRLDARGTTEEHAEHIINTKLDIIRERLEQNIISEDGCSMEEVVVSLLKARSLRLTLAESITGGMMGNMITRIPGCSPVFMGSVVTYSNEMKSALLNVSEETLKMHGAVSHQCAREMAEGARIAGKADIAVSVTGIAGPSGGSAEKPVGSFYIGLATEQTIVSRGFLMPGIREWVRTLAAMQGLDLLRRHLLGFRLHGTLD